jgi:fluoride exporter
MLNLLTIMAGGAIGTAARFGLTGLCARLFGEAFPWGTILVNLSGSFAIGFVAATTGTEGKLLANPMFRQFFMVGVCGGYTTFSSFSLQTLSLAQNGQWLKAGANVLLSVALCLAAVFLGHLLAVSINRAPQ